MKIIQIHNFYTQPGGEDQTFLAECSMLSHNGHILDIFTETNEHLLKFSTLSKITNTIWNKNTAKRIREQIQAKGSEIAHFHNTFPLLSPSVYSAAHSVGTAVVQTLQNYRLLCPNALFLRSDNICEDCLNKFFPWPSIFYACYRASRTASSVTALMLAYHRARKTWQNDIDAYIVVTEFAKRKFIQGGLPKAKIHVVPNCVYPDPGSKSDSGNFALFVGRLSTEKGIRTLLHAWKKLPKIPLKIVGNGPMGNEVKAYLEQYNLEHVEFVGNVLHDEVIRHMHSARFLVFPSEWYEGLPLTIIEAFACGLPVVSSKLGAMDEIVQDNITGLHFIPRDTDDLITKVEKAWSDHEFISAMGKRARAEYEAKYTAERNYEMLMEIYKQALARKT